jgi:hypothetical protein
MDLRSKLSTILVLPPDADAEAVIDALLAESYRCADCARETGGDGLNPADAFAWRKAPKARYGVAPQSYCRRHLSARNGAAQKKRLSDPDARKAQTTRTLKNRANERTKRNAWQRANARKHPEQNALRYRAWVEANPEKRKASQDAYRERQRHHSRPSLKGARVWRKANPDQLPDES